MNIGDTLSPILRVDTQMAEPVDDLMSPYASVSTARSTGRKGSAIRRTAANLRSIVERRFMRMSEAHDRIRTELLARHPPR
jgi:hypothetical protein